MIKVLVSITIFIFLATSYAYCQRMNFGIAGGLNYSGLQSNVIGTEKIKAYHGGVKIKYKLTESFKANLLIMYSHKGSNNPVQAYRNNMPGVRVNESFDFRYIDFPLFLSYEMKVKKLMFYPLIGIHNGFLIKAHHTKIGSVSASGVEMTRNNLLESQSGSDLEVNRYEVGLTGGIGTQLNISNGVGLFIDFRFTQSLSNVFGDGFLEISANKAYFRNNVFSVSTGILF
jgi:hypothetical protein